MNEIKTGLWQNTLDGSYIKVKNVLDTYITYSDEGCAGTHVMNKREIIGCYKLVEADEPAPVVKKQPYQASLNAWVLVRELEEDNKPVIDDTFNDDTPAQTFGDIEFHEGKKYMTRVPNLWRRDEKKVGISSKMRLIGIAGPARAGKDTLASYLLDNLSDDWWRSSFADPLKAMLSVIGVDCSDDAKAVIDDSYGTTPRHMMQTLGTEWGRNLIDSDIWVKAFARLNAGKCVIVPDVRFENEAALVRKHGVLIHLVGRGGIEGNHVSENAIEFKPGDIVIDNSRDLAWLHGQVDGNAVLGDFISEVGE